MYEFVTAELHELSAERDDGTVIIRLAEIIVPKGLLDGIVPTPDSVFYQPWTVLHQRAAFDIGGGVVVTLPSLKELKNPETRAYVEKFYGFGSDASAERIMKVTKLLQHWTAGLHGVGTWHGAGPVQAQKIMVQRLTDYGEMKDLARRMAGIDAEPPPTAG